MMKKYKKEMKFITSRALTHKTIEELKQELKMVKHSVDYWFVMFKNRAFGEIKDGNLSYEEWKDINKRKNAKTSLNNFILGLYINLD